MEPKKLNIRLSRMDEALGQEFIRIIAGVEGCHVFGDDDAGIADLLIMQLGDKPEEEFNLVYQAMKTGAARKIFLTSKSIKPEVLIEAMRAGVKEFFSQPLREDEVRSALQKLLEKKQFGQAAASRKTPGKQGRVINVVGSKGGVGTTTVAVNLANSLQEADKNRSVALMDMNLLFGEIPLFLGLQPTFDWSEVAKNIYRLDGTYLMSVMSRDDSGMYVLPSPARVLEDVRINPAIITTLLQEMKTLFDFIVIDNGQSIDDLARSTAKLSDTLIIVTLLSLPCMINVKRILETFRTFGNPTEEKIRILVNRYQKRSLISLEDAGKSLNKPVAWSIPNDFQNTMAAINQGKPLAVLNPSAEISASFRDVAAQVSGGGVRKKGFFSWR